MKSSTSDVELRDSRTSLDIPDASQMHHDDHHDLHHTAHHSTQLDELDKHDKKDTPVHRSRMMAWLQKCITPVGLFRIICIFGGPLVAMPFLFDILGNPAVSKCAFVTVWMAIWWVTEATYLSVTAFLPFILFPLLGVTDSKTIAAAYFNDVIFLFIGSYFVSAALEKWAIHKRIALLALIRIGQRPKLILFAFMITGWFLSMWLSNTSTAATLLPMAQAILAHLQNPDPITDEEIKKDVRDRAYAKAVILGIVFAVNIGGIGTLVGSPTNMMFPSVLRETYPKSDGFSFLQWISFCMPLSFVLILVTWILFLIIYVRGYRFEPPAIVPASAIVDVPKQETMPNPDKECDKKQDTIEVVLEPASQIKSSSAPQEIAVPSTPIIDAQVSKKANTPTSEPTKVQQPTFVELVPPLQVQPQQEEKSDSDIKRDQPLSSQPQPHPHLSASAILKDEYKKLGIIKFDEIVVLLCFVLMCVLWVTRETPFITNTGYPVGWSSLFFIGTPSRVNFVSDGTVAMSMALLLFLLPSKHNRGSRLLDWKFATEHFPLEVVMLLGAGFALAKAFAVTKLGEFVAAKIANVGYIHPFLWLFIIVSLTIIFTQVSSNTATASIFLPMLAIVGPQMGQNPIFYMLPTAIAASFAFVLPSASPPNALAFTHGWIKMRDMVFVGIGVALIGTILLLVFMFTLTGPILGVWMNEVPSWANITIKAP